jgi:hypothetical protein
MRGVGETGKLENAVKLSPSAHALDEKVAGRSPPRTPRMWFAALLGAALALGCGFSGSPDSPNGKHDHPVYGSAYYFTVSDEATGEILSSGCSGNPPGAVVHAPIGSHLLCEVFQERVANDEALVNPDTSCNANGQVGSSPASYVYDLACWQNPDTSALHVEHWEIIPHQVERGGQPGGLVSGKGYRVWIEVVAYGLLTLEPTGDCQPIDGYPIGLRVRE